MKYWYSLGLKIFLWIAIVFPVLGSVRISNVKCRQRWPWNGLVDITYSVESTLKNSDGSPADVTLSFEGYDRDRNQKIILKTLTGDGAGTPVKAGGAYRTTWNMKQDCPDFNSSAFRIIVKAKTIVKLEADRDEAGRKYLMIDLSGGRKAVSWPYRYSDIGPDISSDKCRTTELWLRVIPAGTFMMGSPADELGRMAGESLHRVTLNRKFYIGLFEITQKQWQLVMGSNPARYRGDDRPVEGLTYGMLRGADAGAGWPSRGYAVDQDSFLGQLRSKTGLLMDLPTDAQWEYACRAGTGTALNSGENLTSAMGKCPRLDKLGRYWENCSDGLGKYAEHARVGSYRPNAWGLYDMLGNVHEWCLDWYQENLGTEPVADPQGADRGTLRLLRGGYWHDLNAKYCRSALRHYFYPDRTENDAYGARVVFLPEEQLPPEPVSKPLMGRYMIIDLEGGPEASAWPCRYSETGPDLGNDKCRTTELWLREIPAGTFMMGSPADELGRTEYEKQHRVTLTKPFYMGVFEVTQRQWELVMGDNPSELKGYDRPVERVSYDSIRGSLAQLGRSWPEDGHKVDSASFMGRLQAKTGVIFDLPTEAQWEYACRAGTSAALNSGKNLTVVGDFYCPHMGEVGRYYRNLHDGRGKYIYHCRVGSYLPNSWGLFDMHGNVEEWCLDESERLGDGPVVDPVGGKGSTSRILRGGSWACGSPEDCRSAYRGQDPPYIRQENIGFRAAVHLPAEEIRK